MNNKVIKINSKVSECLENAMESVIVKLHHEKQESGAKSLLIAGANSGVGVTTMAVNLAVSLANSGNRTLLIDCDIRKREEEKKTYNNTDATLADYIYDNSGNVQLSDIVYTTDCKTLYCLPGGSCPLKAVDILCSDKFRSLINIMYAEYDYIIVDAPSLYTSVDAVIVAGLLDRTLILVDETTRKSSLRRAYSILSKSGANILGVAINKVRKEEYRDYLKNYQEEVKVGC